VRSAPRLAGLDAARGIAFAGMLLAHFARSTSPDDPGWLQGVDNLADGRAAPLFCLLLGIGCGVLSARRGGVALVRRGGALLVLALLLWPFIDRVAFILPHYAVLLAFAGLATRLPRRWLLPLAVASWSIPTVVVAFVDGHGLRTAVQPDSYGDLADVGAVAWQIVWEGAYPVVGWAGFVLVGIWLSRLPLGDERMQVRLMLGGVAVAALQPLFSFAYSSLDGVRKSPDARGVATFFDGSAHSNQLAWYVLSCASAVAVVGACSWLVVRVRTLELVSVLGRMALSVYLLHLVIGATVVWEWRDDARPSLTSQVAVAAVTFLFLALLAGIWSRRFQRGPVESLLRAASG
jgi:uncharacterized protein